MEFDKIIMLFIALLLDLFGLICFILSFFGVGIAISFVPDLIGSFTIGLWLILKRGTLSGFRIARIAPKLGLAVAAELTPFLGDALPSWTILVLTS